MNKKYNQVDHRVYIKGVLTATSPFVVGTDDDYFDLSPLRDESGKPFIPGSSIAGILRNAFEDKEKKEFFGYAENDDSKQSILITYDSFLTKDSPLSFNIRDGIKLNDDRKTTQAGAKTSYEIVEPGCSFDFMLEVVIRENDDTEYCFSFIKSLVTQLQNGFFLGAKTSRGLGKFNLENILTFKISGENAYQNYVAFRWDLTKFIPYQESDFPSSTSINLTYRPESRSFEVKCDGTLLIRSYDDPLGADTIMVNSNASSIIPGSSWNGLFRHQAKRILEELGCIHTACLVNEIFGSDIGDGEDKKQASNIVFSDSVIVEAKSFLQTNVKIDRFTQGAADGALFNCRPVATFKTTLDIQLRTPEQWIWDLLHLIMCDINDGYAALGGQTSIGRGLLKIEIENQHNYNDLLKKIKARCNEEILNV